MSASSSAAGTARVKWHEQDAKNRPAACHQGLLITHTHNAESFERDLMSFSAPSKLYFIAGVLFLLAAAIDFSDRGLELKTVIGLLLASGMVALGLKAGNRKVV